MSRRRTRAEGGQALPLVLAAALVLVLGAVALFVLGRVQLAAARAQTAADLAALSAGRALADDLGRMARDGPQAADAWRARLADVARRATAPGGARLEALRLPDASWPPTSVEVTVSAPGPRGSRALAVARAGLGAPAGSGDGRTGWAAGGGYSGPLRYRDGKPMCPQVTASRFYPYGLRLASGQDRHLHPAEQGRRLQHLHREAGA